MPSEFSPPEYEDSHLEGVVAVPWQKLSPDALEGVLDEYVSREGTDYGDYATNMAAKKQQVLKQLQQGIATLLFDLGSGQCHIELTHHLESSRFLNSQNEG